MFGKTKYAKAVGNDRAISQFIPQSSHLSADTIITNDGDLQRTWRVGGMAFETADPEDVHIPKEQMNTLLRSIGTSKVSLWQHTCMVKTSARLHGDYKNDFCRAFDRKYIDSVNTETMMLTELYLTVVYRPTPSRVVRSVIRAGRRKLDDILNEQQQALQALDDIADQIEASLRRYQLDKLTTFTDDNGSLCSDALSFLNYLISGTWQKVIVPRGSISQYLGDAWLHVGTEMIEIRSPSGTRYAQCIDFKEYNGHTEPGILNGLLYEGYEYVITQSFSCYDKKDGLSVLERQRAHLISTEDGSATQIHEIKDAIDDLVDGQFIMGEYHFGMMVFANSAKQVKQNTKSAMSVLQKQGFLAALTTTATDAAWHAQLPCNWFYRPRVAYITSRNFAGLACLHSFPVGKAQGNPWGQAVTILKTPSGQPFYFNFHVVKADTNQFDEKPLGNTRIIGQSGAGKTTLVNSLYQQSQKYDNRDSGQFSTVLFDKDESAKLSILAAGGKYLSFKSGQPTGLNPFQLEPTEPNILFLEGLIVWLASTGENLVSTTDEQRISQGVRTVMNMPVEMRRLSTLLQNITEGSSEVERQNSVVKRLAKWCADDGNGKQGSLHWVLDCETDQIDLTTHVNYGFDGTEFLENNTVCTPITMILLHRIRSMIDGRRFVNWMIEAWKWLDDPAFTSFTGDEQVTMRKKDGFCVFETQMPKSVLNSSISDELLQQVATEIYLPNPKAKHADYADGFGLTEAEFMVIKSLPEDGHMFLVKQNKNSVVAWLDLEGFDDELAILSGTPENNAIAEAVIADVGDDPALWMPEFHRRRKTKSTTPVKRAREVAA